MIYFEQSDLDINLPDVHRHWDSHSEYYAGGDALTTLMDTGWALGEMVYCEHHWLFNGMRYVDIYHFELRRGSHHRLMAVIGNPFIEELIDHAMLLILPLGQTTRH